jgi:hypothetical protein
MPAQKRNTTREPLLNTVARKLGHAAGTLTKATQELTENLATLPETVSTRMREVAGAAAPVERPRLRAARARPMKGGAALKKKRKSAEQKASRRRPAVRSRHRS